MKKIWLRIRRWLIRRWACATKQCGYYQHYLAYGPAELTHIGFHAAERHCLEAQQRITDWCDANPRGEIPKHLMEFAGRWEARVRA